LVFIKTGVVWILARVPVILARFCEYVHVAELLSLVPFRFGNQIRYQFYRETLESCGETVTINFGTIISSRKTRLGSNIWLGTYNVIGQADIRDHILTASGCVILSGRKGHDFSNTGVPIMHQPYTPVRCAVGPDVWLGANSILMADVGQGCVIGAGSVVVSPIPDWSVAVGNPARVIRNRRSQKDKS
jgi:virginiamycin A acetyltransferase